MEEHKLVVVVVVVVFRYGLRIYVQASSRFYPDKTENKKKEINKNISLEESKLVCGKLFIKI